MEDDETIPDKECDIKPRFHRSRRHSLGKFGDEVLKYFYYSAVHVQPLSI